VALAAVIIWWKPKAVSSRLDPDRQAAFIKSYENLANHIGDDEVVLFRDAVHPTHGTGQRL
jgi:hypothetical protein